MSALCTVAHHGVVVNQAVSVAHRHSKQMQFRAVAFQFHLKVVACLSVHQRYAVDHHVGFALLADIERRNAVGVGRRVLDVIIVEHGLLAGKDFHYLRIEIAHAAVLRMVAHKQTRLCTGLQHNQHTAVGHQRCAAVKNVNKLYGLLHHNPFRNIDKNTVLCKQRVERHLRSLQSGSLAVVAFHEFGVLLSRLLQRLDDYALRQRVFRILSGMESVVEKEIHASAHVRHIAAERVGGICSEVDAVDVHAIVGGKHRFKARHLVVLIAHLGHGRAFQRLQRSIAARIQHTCRMVANGLAVGFIEFYILVNS